MGDAMIPGKDSLALPDPPPLRCVLCFIGSSLNQSQSSWAALSTGKSHGASENSLGKELVMVERLCSKVLVVQKKTQIGQIV